MGAIDAKVSKDLNVGTYNEILYLTDEEGISEPFYLNLTVEGNQPEWAQGVNPKVHSQLQKARFYDLMESDHICPHIDVALQKAREFLEK